VLKENTRTSLDVACIIICADCLTSAHQDSVLRLEECRYRRFAFNVSVSDRVVELAH
jgi:hypothetical protein